ncbi:hypothetical protein KCP78_24985 [Salmonella enterica subsp. enterica]|nr:hypothetical protein KCP78_24985 [Salmonella enterica subsp. enterica]
MPCDHRGGNQRASQQRPPGERSVGLRNSQRRRNPLPAGTGGRRPGNASSANQTICANIKENRQRTLPQHAGAGIPASPPLQQYFLC